MKKAISLVLALTFVFALILQVPVLANDGMGPDAKEDSSLEKISSPDKINLYREIKKIGVDLFGVKKASSTIYNIQKNDDKKAIELKKEVEKKNIEARSELEKKVAEIKKSGMEKITSLEQVKLFDKITKVGNDLFGVKKKGVNILPAMSSDLLACVSQAITTKDNSISITFTNSATEITTAIEARGTCQKNALSLSAGREEALKACSKTFQEATKSANEKAKKAQHEAWAVYKNTLKDCAKAANTTEINIEDGGEILK